MNIFFQKIRSHNHSKGPQSKVKWFFYSLLGALILEVILMLSTGMGGQYGTPLPMGENGGVLGIEEVSPFNLSIFILDVIITASIFLAVTWWNGYTGAAAMTFGGIVSLVVDLFMDLVSLPFIGFPVPVISESSYHPNLLAIWLNSIFFGVLLVLTWRRIHKSSKVD